MHDERVLIGMMDRTDFELEIMPDGMLKVHVTDGKNHVESFIDEDDMLELATELLALRKTMRNRTKGGIR